MCSKHFEVTISHCENIYNYYYGHVWLALPFIRSMDSTILCNKSTCVRLRLRTARARVCVCVCVCVYISVVFINNANAVLITSHVCLLPTYTYTMILDFLFSSNGFNDYIIYVSLGANEQIVRSLLEFSYLCLTLKLLYNRSSLRTWFYTYLLPIKTCMQHRAPFLCLLVELIKRPIFIALTLTWATESKFICVCLTLKLCVMRSWIIQSFIYHLKKWTKTAALLRSACVYIC